MRDGDQAGNLCCLNAELSGRLDSGPVPACFFPISDSLELHRNIYNTNSNKQVFSLTATQGSFPVPSVTEPLNLKGLLLINYNHSTLYTHRAVLPVLSSDC